MRRCLAKDPEDRYQTIKDVAIELRELRREFADRPTEDTTVPPTRSETATASGAGSTSLESGGSSSPSARSSSAEYVVTGIKQHKLVVAVVLLAVVAGAIGLAAYLHARNTEVTIDSRSVRKGNVSSKETNETLVILELKNQNKPLGVSVQHYLGDINWTKLKNSGISFAYIKASDGLGFKDPNFLVNWQRSKAASVLRGAYTVFRPNQDPGQRHNSFFRQCRRRNWDWEICRRQCV